MENEVCVASCEDVDDLARGERGGCLADGKEGEREVCDRAAAGGRWPRTYKVRTSLLVQSNIVIPST